MYVIIVRNKNESIKAEFILQLYRNNFLAYFYLHNKVRKLAINNSVNIRFTRYLVVVFAS